MPASLRNKKLSMAKLAPVAFFSLVGVLFLVLLPFASFPPHIALTGIMNLIAAYGIVTKRFWAKWLVVALFFVATVFSMYTLYYFITSSWIVSVSLIAYATFAWIFTAQLMLRKQVE